MQAEADVRLVQSAFVAAIVLFSSPALAEDAPPATLRSTVQSVSPDGASAVVRTRGGEDRTIHIGPKTVFVLVMPASLGEVKPGSFVGVAAQPGENGALKAMEVHIFPEAMRGTGEGFHPFDLAPGSTMTNGAIAARVDGVNGSKLTVTYKGGEQTIMVDPKAPVVGLEPGARADLKPGASVIARGPRQTDGSVNAAFVLIGKDGLVPPM
jgi:hypothetical protein